MKKIIIRGNTYEVGENEFALNNQYEPIIFYDKLADFDREIFLLQLIASMDKKLEFTNYGESHGSYVYENVKNHFQHSYIDEVSYNSNIIIRIDPNKSYELDSEPLMLLCDERGNINNYNKYIINEQRTLYINKYYDIDYISYLRINNDTVLADNLIHLTFMVKNSGDIFRDVLLENLKIADQVTILDTGSTDNTIDIIKEIMEKEPRIKLYEEPFVDFSTSRNKLMDLAEQNNRNCVFHIMLDDTYILRQGDVLRPFLHNIRSDNFPAFSINIRGIDTVYSSNRIIRPESKLRYQYKIHEIIDLQGGSSVLIPLDVGFIEDLQSNYMQDRTFKRKNNDLKLLFEELEENPENPRNYYYIAETYLCLEDYENAREYYYKRSQMDSLQEEKYDAMYKTVVLDHLHLKKPWEECQKGYMECYNYDPKRPESIFMIGYEYKNKNIPNLAHKFLKQAFEIGLPTNLNMNIKVKQSNYYLPTFLLQTCYDYDDYTLGIQCCERILEYTNNNDNLASYWLNVFSMLEQARRIPDKSKLHLINKKKILFMSDGGWDKWDGETLYKNGIGGSETFTIKYAEWLQKNGNYSVVVCCPCKTEKVFNDVKYIPMENCIEYIKSNEIHYGIVNRYSAYIHLLDKLGVENIYFVAHDIAVAGSVMPILSSLKGILCISNWAKSQFYSIYENIPKSLGSVISYGIDIDKFPKFPIQKHSFIYSSFANRGLLELLKMFPRIVSKYPDATLNVFCDLDNKWLLENHSEQVEQIKVLLDQHKDFVTNYGWVNQKILNIFWSKAHVWLYPCTFAETCCLTSYEAAASRTIAISNDLGALPENVKTIIEGDATTEDWKEKALEKVDEIFNSKKIEEKILNDSYNWVQEEKNFPKVVNNFTNKFLI